jgi:hypothetical protein
MRLTTEGLIPAIFLSTSFLMEKDRNDTDENAIVSLSGFGDRELWYAEGGSDERGEPTWKFPIFVDWKESAANGAKYACLFPAVCPHYAASVVLKAFFELHDKLNRDNQWLIRADMVPALLKKAPGITPERYYRWAGKNERPISYSRTTMPGMNSITPFTAIGGSGARALIQQVADAAGVQNSVVKIVLNGLNKVAADFLIAQHCVMDLGFAKLIAVPFRANWKEIVCFKLRKLGLMKHLKEEDNKAADEGNNGDRTGLPETLCSPHNVAIRREYVAKMGYRTLSRVDYSIEVITSKAFEKEATRLETRHRSSGHTAYVGYYEKTVERLYENILEILRAYRKKIGYPFARIREGSRTGGLRFVETVGTKARAHGRNLRDLPVHIVPPAHGFSAIAEESQQELVCEAAPEVPKLPNFSQALDDVRQRKEPRSLEEFLNGAGGDGGLPLCHVDQIENSRQPMLLEPAAGGEPSRLDQKGD